jgi:hypothetical protein
VRTAVFPSFPSWLPGVQLTDFFPCIIKSGPFPINSGFAQKLTHFNHKPEKDTDKSPEICKKRKKINRFTRKTGEWACQKRPSPVYSSQRQARRCWFRMAAALRAAGGKKTRGRNYGQAEAEHYRIPEL